jgi:hypothetical protein|tara:strand:- start:6902 stop:7315 length:414 start_codon:yes stop_codon:yes gene_type:complete
MAMVITYDEGGPVNTIIGTWTSTSGGNAVADTKKISGELIKAITIPDSVDVPTDSYDLRLFNADDGDINLLADCDQKLGDRSDTNTEEVYFIEKDHDGAPLAKPTHPVVNGLIELNIRLAGDTKKGVCEIYWKPLRA